MGALLTMANNVDNGVSVVFNLPSAGPSSDPVEVIRDEQTKFMALKFPSTMQAGTTLKIEVRALKSDEDWAVVHDGGSELALPAEPDTALSTGDMSPLACWVNHEWRVTPSANPSSDTVLVLRIS